MRIARPEITQIGGNPNYPQFGVPAGMGGMTGGNVIDLSNDGTLPIGPPATAHLPGQDGGGPQPNAMARQRANPRARFNRFLAAGGQWTPGWRRQGQMQSMAPDQGMNQMGGGMNGGMSNLALDPRTAANRYSIQDRQLFQNGQPFQDMNQSAFGGSPTFGQGQNPWMQSMNGGGYQSMPQPHPIYSMLPQFGGMRPGIGGFGMRGGG